MQPGENFRSNTTQAKKSLKAVRFHGLSLGKTGVLPPKNLSLRQPASIKLKNPPHEQNFGGIFFGISKLMLKNTVF
jgi:hypothetical protein